ncbi:23S rRNA (uridine(2552)-2'-O)-methyltransferase RlmE [Sinimarinibacterium sp. NLF-5-8]|uniref:23S rRNA (uridine(2552)-2'-O)-methyltransferase RlmE n=1 Tax=Sinimarinibacterium sp. NLF-5-8 TaxID=2698684 RepID=UPI00137C2106|nr:23S rRNA (uridine(2552)-2'-O)-methyltransferase RlmE [Sinimarinibacterium sp. NLF-5-8]QHS09545.1 23S rRNA (uridine(2552)-2'-O)-methyltransferase RlmE [Sinimarinibacterium sp. NLF-5-8]
MTQKRRASSARWLAEHEADPYVQEARRLGLRSRAAFKLKEIQERDKIMRPGQIVVDLGAAPGGWSQIARPMLGARGQLFALDILPFEPIAGVDIIVGDFREDAVLLQLEERVGDQMVDLVLSDMAPNLSGIEIADQASSMYLCELALEFAKAHLKPRGSMLVKVFQGEGFDAYLKSIREVFDSVTIRKPKASRPRSNEVYVLARNFRAV